MAAEGKLKMIGSLRFLLNVIYFEFVFQDTSEDCIIHHHQGPSSSSGSGPPVRKTSQSSATSHSHSAVHHKRNNMELIQLLAINALEFTAPVYSFLNKSEGSSSTPTSPSSPPHSTSKLLDEQTKELLLTKKTSTELKLEREFIQLSGHQGTFAPAGWVLIKKACLGTN